MSKGATMAERGNNDVRVESKDEGKIKKAYEPPRILYQGCMEKIAGSCGKTPDDPDNCAILGPSLS
jgi:hypothetical protein